ncbi:type II/III secretion system protein [Janthinobacterium sp. 67]|uniref:type II secretion system protein GspD n=1 Tax=Janthinobacterium sp. 67 TaxID=2035207 RepID=UPI000CBBD9E7|nr:hypothetical protein [Janthinobacterium sp. 67]PJJ20744.1 type II/III secretion system protein [Janthinobacterium sp. 67]
MRRFLSALILAPVLAFAAPAPAPVSLSFDATPLMAFGEAMFKAIMHRDFVVSPDVIGIDKRITIKVKNIDAAELPRFVEDLLLREGIATTLKGGIYYLSLNRQAAVNEPQGPPPNSLGSFTSTTDRPSASEGNSATHPSDPLAVDHAAASRKDDDESVVFTPQNRDADFMVAIANAAFGPRSAVRAGPHLVLTGSKATLEKLHVLLDTADTTPKGLTVSASWIEVSRNDTSGRGISLLANVLGAKLGVALGSVNSGSAVSIKNANFELVIDALKTDGRFKQVSNSRVSGDDYEPMNITFGDETPTVSSTGKDNVGNPVQNVVYRPSGVIVDVVAKVLGSGKVKIAIDGQISSFKATSTGVSGSPTLIKRQVKTTITVSDGEVLLLGGLNDSQSSDTSSGLPFLPSSWAVTSNNSTQTELVLVLSARTNN